MTTARPHFSMKVVWNWETHLDFRSLNKRTKWVCNISQHRVFVLSGCALLGTNWARLRGGWRKGLQKSQTENPVTGRVCMVVCSALGADQAVETRARPRTPTVGLVGRYHSSFWLCHHCSYPSTQDCWGATFDKTKTPAEDIRACWTLWSCICFRY